MHACPRQDHGPLFYEPLDHGPWLCFLNFPA
uniref:Uncharacterized protein n=1 Tax=Arundo donax TaxID=35708 RepID=A0A0A8ZU87_ARUDO